VLRGPAPPERLLSPGKSRHQAPGGRTGAPPPRRTRERQALRRDGQRRFLLAPDAPPGVHVALRARHGVAQPGGQRPPRPAGSLPPSPDASRIDRDAPAGPPPRMPCCQGPPRAGVRRLLRTHTAPPRPSGTSKPRGPYCGHGGGGQEQAGHSLAPSCCRLGGVPQEGTLRASALIAWAYASTLARNTTENCSRLVTTRRSMLSS